MPEAASLILKPSKEASVHRGHPWVFSGAVARLEGQPETGETVALRNNSKQFLAWAAYSPESSIRARVWSRTETDTIDAGFFRRRIQIALELRSELGLLDAANDACRLVFAESDRLPGLIVDRYGSRLVVQLLSAGAERWRGEIAGVLSELTGLEDIFERSDVEVRKLEGLEPVNGVLRGAAPAGPIEIQEDGLLYRIDVVHGHKTGFYLDQRPNRRLFRSMADGCDVLNAFAYTGSFTVAALAGGASTVLSIESSREAVAGGVENVRLNGFAQERSEWIEGDVFVELRLLRDRGRSFDLIVLDPPKFAATRAQAERAARGYKDINLLALKLLRPGGKLVSFSCSGGIDAALFRKILSGAAVDAADEAGADIQVLERLSQGPDHPVSLSFPEGEYLKGLVLRKSN